MPAVAKVKCECGCRQAPASSTRQRLVRCACGNSFIRRMSDEELALAYESACAMESGLYDAGLEDSSLEAQADALTAEMIRRGLA